MSSDQDSGHENQEISADDIEVVGDDSSSSGGEPQASNAEDTEKWKNDYLYLKAEFENYKKQAIKERSQLLKYGTEHLVRELLDVLDNFDRALNVEVREDNLDSYKQGIELTAAELMGLLNRFGVTVIEPLGEAFDPQVHEALSSEETDKVPPGHISQVYKKAYKLHDKVIRPAQVVVAKEISSPSEDSESSN